MKLFPCGHATHPQWRMAAALVLAQLRAQMALPDYASRRDVRSLVLASTTLPFAAIWAGNAVAWHKVLIARNNLFSATTLTKHKIGFGHFPDHFRGGRVLAVQGEVRDGQHARQASMTVYHRHPADLRGFHQAHRILQRAVRAHRLRRAAHRIRCAAVQRVAAGGHHAHGDVAVGDGADQVLAVGHGDEAEIARRRPERLTPRQRALLDSYGYPFVMEEFRFHLTLTGPLDPWEIAPTESAIAAHFGATIPQPFQIKTLCLFGEAQDGTFHLLHRYALTG